LEYNGGRPGIHHIAFTVSNIMSIQQMMQEKGINLLEKFPVHGAGDFIVNFLKLKDTGGY
jgi:lactoylglutathione lyase/methylmalonyl-CoA/ethylmalonyl-CoA epimerase